MKNSKDFFKIIFCIWILIFTSSCSIFYREVNFSYRELNANLIRVEYYNFISTEAPSFLEEELVLTLSENDKEHVLNEIDKMVFSCYLLQEPVLPNGRGLKFIYEEYQILFTTDRIDKTYFDSREIDEQNLFWIRENNDLENLFEYLDNCK